MNLRLSLLSALSGLALLFAFLLISGCVETPTQTPAPVEIGPSAGSEEPMIAPGWGLFTQSYDGGGFWILSVAVEDVGQSMQDFGVEIDYPFVAQPCSSDFNAVVVGCQDYDTDCDGDGHHNTEVVRICEGDFFGPDGVAPGDIGPALVHVNPGQGTLRVNVITDVPVDSCERLFVLRINFTRSVRQNCSDHHNMWDNTFTVRGTGDLAHLPEHTFLWGDL